MDKALDQMKAIQGGQLMEADLSAEDRANLSASKAALTDVMNNQARMQQQTEALELVLAEAQTTREQLLKSNDRDIALGIRAYEGLAAIHSLEAAGRLGKLFDVPIGTAIATSFDLAEGLKSAPEFIAKANEQAGAMMTEVQSRAASLFGTAVSAGSGTGGSDSAAAGRDREASSAMDRLRKGFEDIAKPAVETAKFVPDRFDEGKTLKELVRPPLTEAKDGIIQIGLDRAGRTVAGIDSGIAAKEAFDAFRQGDLAAAKEKFLDAAVSATGAYNSDVGALSNAVNNVRKDVAGRQELI
ncbi:MAG: hypothetical protein G4V63_30145, partial [Candidatus Afipia apatlaquensis]|nr:hypothetical protein [Candidatus Afipia apatlaquensis]